MNDQLHPEPNDRRDVLIGRIIDGEATGQDWAEFRQLAGDDESVFAEIAELQDLRKRTIDIVEQVGDLADTIELPVHMHPKASPAHRLRTAGVWGGWAVAGQYQGCRSVIVRDIDPAALIGLIGEVQSGRDVFEQELTADLPAANQFLTPRLFMNNGATAAAVAFDCAGVYLETDF